MHKGKNVIGTGKGRKTLNGVKSIENTNRNLSSFLQMSPMQKEVLPEDL